MDAAQFWHAAANVFGAAAATVCGLYIRSFADRIVRVEDTAFSHEKRIARIEGRLKI